MFAVTLDVDREPPAAPAGRIGNLCPPTLHAIASSSTPPDGSSETVTLWNDEPVAPPSSVTVEVTL
jgi:hypothetical protein